MMSFNYQEKVMPRIASMPKEKASKEVAAIYDDLTKKIGKVPNIFLHMGNSPAILKGYLALSDAAGQSSLSAKVREEIALVVSQANNCNYCLSAHTVIGKGAGLSEQEILAARKGAAADSKTKAILIFSKAVVDKKGLVNDSDVTALKSAGVSDQEIADIILVVIQTIFTNYFNHIVDTPIDFPLAAKI